MTKVIRSNGRSRQVNHRFEHEGQLWGETPEWMEEARKFDSKLQKPSAQSSVLKKK